MKAVLQRVKSASVTIEEKTKSEIRKGLLVLLGIEESDTDEDIAWLSGKVARMRLFPDEGGVMNLSIRDIEGELLVVSQFTLHANTKKGNRPSYIKAAVPATAIPLYEKFITQMEADLGKPIQTGEFGAMMNVQLINDGPVTIVIDSKNKS
jgi:D-tyrosyl-tRNA(Tyr) deacylase